VRIAVSTDGPDLKAQVACRFGVAGYLLIVDLDTSELETAPVPGASHQQGGMQTVILAIDKRVDAVLTGWCSPHSRAYMESRGIRVIDAQAGSAAEAVESFARILRSNALPDFQGIPHPTPSRLRLISALKISAAQFYRILPVVVGVIFSLGLFSVFFPRSLLYSIFSGNTILDAFLGACFGSIFAGNPINSYLISGELLKAGVGLVAVTAFLVAWVGVGVVQLPSEIVALGRRFALIRNGIAFVFSILTALITVFLINGLSF
jgi:predicted Fe-Mo cluster-binding NifX family protein